MTEEYIRRADIMQQFTASDMQKKLRSGSGEDAYAAFLKIANDAPAADVTPAQHGEWISDDGDVLFHCSECETQISTSWKYEDLNWNYCPECGAKMDGERREK